MARPNSDFPVSERVNFAVTDFLDQLAILYDYLTRIKENKVGELPEVEMGMALSSQIPERFKRGMTQHLKNGLKRRRTAVCAGRNVSNISENPGILSLLG